MQISYQGSVGEKIEKARHFVRQPPPYLCEIGSFRAKLHKKHPQVHFLHCPIYRFASFRETINRDGSSLLTVGTSLANRPPPETGKECFHRGKATKTPREHHTCTVCTGTACYVKGADRLLAALSRATGLAAGQTTVDGTLTLRTVRCLESCGIAPVAERYLKTPAPPTKKPGDS